jgi:hypothetical protein
MMAGGVSRGVFVMAGSAVMIVVVVIRISAMIKVQHDVSEQQVMMVTWPADRVLDTGHGASHGCLHENKDQRGA